MAEGTAAAWLVALGTVGSAAASVWSSAKMQSAGNKARRENRAAIAKATAAAAAERERIDNLDRERKERLRKKGAQLPPSLLSGLSGATGPPTTLKPILG